MTGQWFKSNLPYISNDCSASHHRTLESSEIPLWEPQIPHCMNDGFSNLNKWCKASKMHNTCKFCFNWISTTAFKKEVPLLLKSLLLYEDSSMLLFNRSWNCMTCIIYFIHRQAQKYSDNCSNINHEIYSIMVSLANCYEQCRWALSYIIHRDAINCNTGSHFKSTATCTVCNKLQVISNKFF